MEKTRKKKKLALIIVKFSSIFVVSQRKLNCICLMIKILKSSVQKRHLLIKLIDVLQLYKWYNAQLDYPYPALYLYNNNVFYNYLLNSINAIYRTTFRYSLLMEYRWLHLLSRKKREIRRRYKLRNSYRYRYKTIQDYKRRRRYRYRRIKKIINSATGLKQRYDRLRKFRHKWHCWPASAQTVRLLTRCWQSYFKKPLFNRYKSRLSLYSGTNEKVFMINCLQTHRAINARRTWQQFSVRFFVSNRRYRRYKIKREKPGLNTFITNHYRFSTLFKQHFFQLHTLNRFHKLPDVTSILADSATSPFLWYYDAIKVPHNNSYSFKTFGGLDKKARLLRWQTSLCIRTDKENRRVAKTYPLPLLLMKKPRMLYLRTVQQKDSRYAQQPSYLIRIINRKKLNQHYYYTAPYRKLELFVWDQIFVANFLYQRLMFYGESTASQFSVLSMLQYLKQWICQHLIEFIENFLVTGFPVFFELVRVKQSNREHDFPIPIRRKTLRGFMLKKFITKFRRRHHIRGFFSSFVEEILAWQLEPALSFLFQYFEEYYDIGMDTRFFAHFRWGFR
jgi:hypothetical protein